jgi:uncharacterized repeat protein (TIGR03803 family)
MNRELPLAIVFTLLVCSACRAGAQAVVAYTFVCNGKTIGFCPDGAIPNSLIQGSDGNFYGTAGYSAVGETTGDGGVVFSLTPAGKFTLLHAFVPGPNGNFANGKLPFALTEGPDGNLYGMTEFGGNGPTASFPSYGVVFRMSKTGSGFQILHRFCSVGSCSDGGRGAGSLVVGTDGNLYGATSLGGAGTGCDGGGCGLIFRITPSTGAYEVASVFSLVDGEDPYGLIPAGDGTFYGFAVNGTNVFQFTPSTGTLQSSALSFPFPSGCPGFACFVQGIFALGPNGNLYGFYKVYPSFDPGLFEVEPNGSNLQFFPVVANLGPELLLASDGNFWYPATGSTYGTLVTISPSDGAIVQTLTPFSESVSNPTEIIQAADGTLWGVGGGVGTVSGSGHFSGGTIFSLNVGLPRR